MIYSAEEFKRLRESENIEEYTRGSQEEASEQTWMDVIESYPELKVWVVHNKTVPLSILGILARDEGARVREWVAGKRKLSHELFSLLASDVEYSVRNQIGMNPKVPTDILMSLATDKDPWVRRNIIAAIRDRQVDLDEERRSFTRCTSK